MELEEKLAMFELSPEQEKIAKEKFLTILALVSKEEIHEILAFLKLEGIVIKKARELKVVANSKEEIVKKINILGEVHDVKMYEQNPLLINKNVIDIYKKIKYCMQNNIPYKKDGTYENFLFNEIAWQKVFNRDGELESEIVKPIVEEEIVTIDPIIDVPELETPLTLETKDEEHMDIKEYMMASDDVAELEAKTTNFAAIREELEGQLAELDSLKNMNYEDTEISFNDLEPETYGMGRAA